MSNVHYWNSRAGLGPTAGTQDLIAAELERRAIGRYVRDGMRVLDCGCGNGTTVLRLASEHRIEIVGIDSAVEMIAAAKQSITYHVMQPGEPPGSEIRFAVADVLTAEWGRPFDLVYSERLLINLPDWPTQRAAIERILSWLNPGGTALFVECSQEGLWGINQLRAMLGLPAITPPSHNLYLREDEMQVLANALGDAGTAWLVDVEAPLSTYALCSRVLNAALAAEEGKQPDYNASINRLALKLPNVGYLGQNRMWEFRKI